MVCSTATQSNHAIHLIIPRGFIILYVLSNHVLKDNETRGNEKFKSHIKDFCLQWFLSNFWSRDIVLYAIILSLTKSFMCQTFCNKNIHFIYEREDAGRKSDLLHYHSSWTRTESWCPIVTQLEGFITTFALYILLSMIHPLLVRNH